MARDIGEWLEGLELTKYVGVFVENEIDLDTLPHLAEADLKELGLPMGPRKKILAAIAEFETAEMAPSDPGAPKIPRPEAERRQLTVMFCDLVGSTELSVRLDAEDLREILRAYQNTVAGEVARFDGHVAKFMGDGVLVYFGYPRAHEDDAERAARAGLDIIEAVGAIKAAGLESLQARIGIATGRVVVGDLVGEGAAQEEAVVGETPNLAARLQALAGPDAVVISPSTRRLLGRLFECEDLGEQHLKGIGGGVRPWRVVRERPAESRFEARQAAGLIPFVGRDQEIELLLHRWQLARQGEGQVVLLSGEPGIGKSRITETLRDRIGDQLNTRLRYQCSPYHTNSAFYPIIYQLEQAAQFERNDTPEQKLDKLEALLSLPADLRRGPGRQLDAAGGGRHRGGVALGPGLLRAVSLRV